MKMFRVSLEAVLIWLMLFAFASGAVKMQPTPVQDQMNLAVAGLAANDEFDEFDESPDRKSSTDVQPAKRVSVARVALLSALLPGLGEYHVGNRKKAKYFFGAEALTWVGFIAFRTYGSWKKDDLIRFAGEYAGASLEGKSDEFLDWVGFYTDIDEFNTLGRVGDPDRPYLEDIPENHWRWLSEEDQEAYRDLKNSSREAYRRANFMIGVAVVNRVLSVIDAVRDARRANSRLDTDTFSDLDELHYKLKINPLSTTQQISLTIYTPF